jgi:hypothetical protein
VSGKQYHDADGDYGFHGESCVRQYIKSNGYHANKHPNGIYREDVEFVSNRERFFIEVERCGSNRWDGSDWWNWPTLHVLARRKVEAGTLFFTLSADMKKAYVSFPLDLLCVAPVRKNNRFATGEEIRDHEILRCLPLDMTQPIAGSIAEMNANRVREIVATSQSYTHITRVLTGREPYAFEAPYGVDDDEWREMILDVERRSGLGAFSNRSASNKGQRRLF